MEGREVMTAAKYKESRRGVLEPLKRSIGTNG